MSERLVGVTGLVETEPRDLERAQIKALTSAANQRQFRCALTTGYGKPTSLVIALAALSLIRNSAAIS